MKFKQKNISKILGISDTLLSRILSGQRNITYPMAKKLNKLSRIEVDFWMTAEPKAIKQELKRLRIEEETT